MKIGQLYIKTPLLISIMVIFSIFSGTLFQKVKDNSSSIGISTPVAQAFSTDNVSGFAWSSNIGWISFNCKDTLSTFDVCPGSQGAVGDYGVRIDLSGGTDNGEFSGYAWSSNVGWITFNEAEVSGCPTPIGGRCVSKLDTTTNEVSGFARACSVFQSGCTGPLRSNLERGGWDGWIEMSGNWQNPVTRNGVNYDTNSRIGRGVFLDTDFKLKGFAWGGEVIGWVDFFPNLSGGVSVNILGIEVKESNSGSWTTGPLNINLGDTVDVRYTVGGSPSSCTALGGPRNGTGRGGMTNWNNSLVGSNVPSSSSGPYDGGTPPSSIAYTLECSFPSGTMQASLNVVLPSAPDFNVTVNPSEHRNMSRSSGSITKSSTLAVVPIGGFSDDVDISAVSVKGYKGGVMVNNVLIGNGAGQAQVSITPNTLSSPYSGGSQVTVTLGANVPRTNAIEYYEVLLRATSGSIVKDVTIRLQFIRETRFQEG